MSNKYECFKQQIRKVARHIFGHSSTEKTLTKRSEGAYSWGFWECWNIPNGVQGSRRKKLQITAP